MFSLTFMVRGPIINHRKKNHMKCLEQVWQYFLTIRASLLFLDGGSSSSPFRLACIDGKTQTPISSFFKSRFKLTSLFNGLWVSSGAKCSEHNEEVFPGTHIFLLSNTKSTHFFRLFFLIGHTSPKNGILCMDIFLSGSFTLPQRAATHLSGIINLGLGRRDVTGRTDTSSWSYVIIRHGYYLAERRLIRMVDQNGSKFRRL